MNVVVLMSLHGKELGWVNLGACGADVRCIFHMPSHDLTSKQRSSSTQSQYFGYPWVVQGIMVPVDYPLKEIVGAIFHVQMMGWTLFHSRPEVRHQCGRKLLAFHVRLCHIISLADRDNQLWKKSKRNAVITGLLPFSSKHKINDNR